MRGEKQDLYRSGEAPLPARVSGGGDVLDPTWAEGALFEERAGAMHRTGQRLGRLLRELRGIERDLDRLDLTLQLPGLSGNLRRDLHLEMDLSVDAYNHLREAAASAYQQLVQQRESFGFRGHEAIRRCYPIPELLLPPDPIDELDLEAQ